MVDGILKSKNSLFQFTNLFLVMFFLAHHGAPLCSEYFPPFFFSFFFLLT